MIGTLLASPSPDPPLPGSAVNPGDLFTDRDDRAWTVDRDLGTGTWCRTLLVRSRAGDEAVLRLPHAPVDLSGPDAAQRSAACLERCEQLAARLASKPTWAPTLLGRATASDGRPMLLMRRYPSSVARRIEDGAPLTEILRIVYRTGALLREAGIVHGNLHGRSILLDEAGRPILDDVWTPAAARCGVPTDGYRPPEAAAAPEAGWDTWALCALLYQAALTTTPGADGRRPSGIRIPDAGLDKVAIATLKDRAQARLAAERSNPRFRGRLADRLGAVLNRGISLQHTPSPPYRFISVSALIDRLKTVVELIDPRVDEVGRILLPPDARDAVFQGDVPITFAVTVATTTSVDTHEDLVCGVALRDLDAEDEARVPVPEARYETRTHPSGRLRFAFTLPGVGPGRYRASVAFAVKDSGHPPATAQGEFEVRPQPGWVPPAEEVAPAPLSFPGTPPEQSTPEAPEPAEPAEPAADPEAFASASASAPSIPDATDPSEPFANVHALPSPVRPPAYPAPVAAPAPPTPVAPPTSPPRPRPTPLVAVEVEVSDPGYRPLDEATIPQARPAGVSSSAETAPFESYGRELGTDAGDWTGPGQWEAELPEPSLTGTFGDDSPLPGLEGHGEDLLGEDHSFNTYAPEGVFDRVLEIIKRDTYTSFVAAFAACLIIIVILTLFMTSC